MRDVTIDELFTWKDDAEGSFALKAAKAFGGHNAYVNHKTYGDIRERCDVIERTSNRYLFEPPIPQIDSFYVRIDDSIPDGILRGAPMRIPKQYADKGIEGKP